jgi:hypothetical protein
MNILMSVFIAISDLTVPGGEVIAKGQYSQISMKIM